MSAGTNAIIARMGLDLGGLRGDLTAAEKVTVRAMNQMAAASKHAGAGHEGLFKSANKVEKTFEGLSGRLLSATDGFNLMTSGAEHLASALHLPLAVGVSIAAAAAAYEKLHEALEKVEAASAEAQKELNKPLGVQGGLSADGIQQQLAGIDKVIEKQRESRGYLGTLAAFYQEMFTGENAVRESMQKEDELIARKSELSAAIAERVEAETRARDIGRTVSEREGALLQVQLATEEKIAKLRLDASLSVDARQALIRGAQAEGDAQADDINAKYALKERELALARELAKIEAIGRDVAVEKARVTFAAAQREVELARTSEAAADAAVKRDAAAAALRTAQQQSAELKEQQRVAKEMAAFRGTAEARAYVELTRQTAELERQAKNATDDEREKLDVLIAQSKEKERQAQIGALQSAFGKADAAVDARTGRGENDKYQALGAKRFNAANELAALTAIGADEETLQKVRDRIGEINRGLAEMIEQRRRGNTAAKADTLELELQRKHQDTLAGLLKTHLEFQTKINEARRNGNKDLETELIKQQKLTVGMQAQQAAKDAADANKGTLAELAAHGIGPGSGKARAAQRWEDRANEARMKGHEATAKRLQERADKLKQDIPALKNSEKDKAMSDQIKQGMDATQMAKDVQTLAQKFGKVI